MKKLNTVIATHDGSFHADDTMAIAILARVFNDLNLSRVIRTRRPELLAEADLRVDVGGRYDPLTEDFDHHQVDDVSRLCRAGGKAEFAITDSDTGEPQRFAIPLSCSRIPYAACGLVWRTYGGPLLAARQLGESYQLDGLNHGGPARLAALHRAIDDRLIAAIDAADCGLARPESNIPTFSLSYAVSLMNRNPMIETDNTSQREAFERAVRLCGDVLDRVIISELASQQAVRLVDHAIHRRSGSRVLVLDKGCNWQQAFFANPDNAQFLYVVYPQDGRYMVQCVPDRPGGFGKRKPLPASWAGLRDDEFRTLTGVEEALFCHPNLFICGAWTYSAAMRLASRAIEATK